LFDSFECDVEWKTCDLKIKLEACDTFWCTSNLEVHVAEVIFCAEDVSQEHTLGDFTILVLFSHEASGDTSTGCCNWHTCIHEREATATNRCHRSRAIRAHHFRDNADRVWELVFWWKDWQEGALCKCTMADFAAPCESETTCFTNRERREVVVQDERLTLGTTCEAIDVLCVTASA
jgi:hypothetical protein